MSIKKLAVVVLFGSLTLGFSSVARADLYMQWVRPNKTDCPSVCGKTGLKYPVPTGIDEKGKLSFHICLAFGDDKWGRGTRVGFNRNGELSCITVVDNKMYSSKEYYCQCSNDPRPRIPR